MVRAKAVVRMTIQLSPELVDEVHRTMEERGGLTMAEVVRQALRQWVEQYREPVGAQR